MQKILIILLLCFISVVGWGAEVIRYVDPDSAAGGDGTTWTLAYDSLQDWDTAEATDLQVAGDWHHVYVRSLSGTADTTNVVITANWNTDSTHYILIEAASTDRADADGWDAAKYRLSITIDGEEAIYTLEPHTYVDGLQVESLGSATPGECIMFAATSGEGRVSNCRLRNSSHGIYHSKSAGSFVLKAWNNIIDTMTLDGIYYRTSTGTCAIYNCTIYGCTDDGVQTATVSTTSVYNSAVFVNGDDFIGTFTAIDFCASDDNDGTNNVAESGGGADWPSDFTTAGSGDFTLVSGSNLIGATTDKSSGLFTDDIEGTTRGAAWDVGAFEYVASGDLTFTAHKDIILGFSLLLNIFSLCAVFLLIRKNRAYKRELAFFQNEEYLEAWCEINQELK